MNWFPKWLCATALVFCCGCATRQTLWRDAHELRLTTPPVVQTAPNKPLQDAKFQRTMAPSEAQASPSGSGREGESGRRESERGKRESERNVREDTRRADLRAPVPIPPVLPPPASEYPIDLATALRLAEVENPTIAAARAAITEALAAQTAARVTASAIPQCGHQLPPAYRQSATIIGQDSQSDRAVALRRRRSQNTRGRVDRGAGGEHLQHADGGLVRTFGRTPAGHRDVVYGASHGQ